MQTHNQYLISRSFQWYIEVGIFTIKVLLFEHMAQGFHFCYLQNTKFRYNHFKCEILDNLNYDNSYGGGDFSHSYVTMHQYFGKTPKM
jgi:hypothetical protein